MHAKAPGHGAGNLHIEEVRVGDVRYSLRVGRAVGWILDIAVEDDGRRVEGGVVDSAKDEVALNPFVGDAVAAADDALSSQRVFAPPSGRLWNSACTLGSLY